MSTPLCAVRFADGTLRSALLRSDGAVAVRRACDVFLLSVCVLAGRAGAVPQDGSNWGVVSISNENTVGVVALTHCTVANIRAVRGGPPTCAAPRASSM